MAITRAQQYRQMLEEGGRLGYRFGSRGYQGSDPKTGKGGASKGPSGKSPGGGGYTGAGGGADAGGSKSPGGGTFKPPAQKYVPGPGDTGSDDPPSPIAPPEESKKEENKLNDFIQLFVPSRRKFYNYATSIPGSTDRIVSYRKAYADYLTSLGIDPTEELLDTENLYDYFEKQAFDKTSPTYKDVATDTVRSVQNYGDFIAENFGAPAVKYSGNVGNLETFVKERDPITGKPTKYGYREKPSDDGPSEPIIPVPDATTPSQPTLTPIQQLLADRGIAYRFMADGGMTNDAPVEGGIMDLESGRQMYFLGKLVKKATRAVKKIAKSPVGKMALAYGLTGGLSNLAGGQKFFTNFFSPSSFISKKGLGDLFSKEGLEKIGPMRLISGASLLSGLLTDEEDEDENKKLDRGPGLDIAGIRQNPYAAMGSAYGFYADGGDVKEPVAKKTMPLLNMGGMEKDYRADGGFVPIGRMERADDVPARLSKNEFVFTADAVRNAGDGDIDKGAEVMYNMMKNLEAGGNVSKESQGLEGARNMFQTSQRLEEVL